MFEFAIVVVFLVACWTICLGLIAVMANIIESFKKRRKR